VCCGRRPALASAAPEEEPSVIVLRQASALALYLGRGGVTSVVSRLQTAVCGPGRGTFGRPAWREDGEAALALLLLSRHEVPARRLAVGKVLQRLAP
jgi:hypothetical protein